MQSFEASAPGQGDLRWRKSSYSGGGNDCVEVAFAGGDPLLRDSKDPAGGTIAVSATEWRALLGVIESGHLDLA